MTTFSRVWGMGGRLMLAGVVWSVLVSGSAFAQTAGAPNTGALTFTGGVAVPSTYVFRGIRQERDPRLTLWPYGDIGLALLSSDSGRRIVGINFGVWNSLQTGSSGSDGPSARLHYQEDFYSTLTFGFGGGINVGTTFTARTSPNAMFNTVQEVSLKVSQSRVINPYGLVAFELSDDGQLDGGSRKGTYLELGAGPRFTLMADGPTLTVPIKLGLSLSDYYEGPTGDEKFGFFDVGGLMTVPLNGLPDRFGSWNIHGGADVLLFGDSTKLYNNLGGAGEPKKYKVVGLFGIGLTY